MSGLDPQQYRELLQAALSSAWDADTIDPDLRTLFTPDSHRVALDPDVTVVRGARGVGKTVWFKALQDADLREIAAEVYRLGGLTKLEPLAGYGSRLAPEQYPGPAALAQLSEAGGDPAEIWTTVLLHGLGTAAVTNMSSWRDRLAWTRNNPDALDEALAQADHQAREAGIVYVILFDALDRLHSSRSRADQLTAGVLRLALDLRTRTRSLRAKVFIRHDMFDSAKLQFPDASKLAANAAQLTWSISNLYGLLFHRMGNTENDFAAAFRESTPAWELLKQGVHVSKDLVGDQERQKQVFSKLAGPYMGAGHRKGLTYPWLPNHLMDGIEQVSPRSFLRALSKAVEVTQAKFAAAPHALHYEGIREGVQAASRIRVTEVAEDLPWVATAISPLRGLQVPVEQQVVIDRWVKVDLAATLKAAEVPVSGGGDESKVRAGPRSLVDYEGLVAELISLGVMSRRKDDRLDLPDVYRIAFDIGRKGGVPRIPH